MICYIPMGTFMENDKPHHRFESFKAGKSALEAGDFTVEPLSQGSHCVFPKRYPNFASPFTPAAAELYADGALELRNEAMTLMRS